MKKSLIITLTLILFTLFSSQAFASSNQSTTTATIDYVYYDSHDQTYYAVSTLDASQGRWVLEIESSDTMDIITLAKLNRVYSGEKMVINFVGDINTEEDIEIVSSELIKGEGKNFNFIQ